MNRCRRVSASAIGFWRSGNGLFTLEGSFVMPLVMILTLLMLFLTILLYVLASLYAGAARDVERAAFAWDNSHRNPANGAFYPGEYDPLYWRLTSDGSKELPVGGGERGKAAGAVGLVGTKLLAASWLPFAGAAGEMGYANRLWLARTVSAAFSKSVAYPAWLKRYLHVDRLYVEASSEVSDPAEWMRTTDFIRNVWPKLRETWSKQSFDKAVASYKPDDRSDGHDEPLSFDYEVQARRYLQQLVNGTQERIDTRIVGEWRLIDAMDAGGIAHQCYLGGKSDQDADVRFQMAKDAELLRDGKVNGVVWHFFQRNKDGTIGPDPALRAALESRGIVVVVHEAGDGR